MGLLDTHQAKYQLVLPLHLANHIYILMFIVLYSVSRELSD